MSINQKQNSTDDVSWVSHEDDCCNPKSHCNPYPPNPCPPNPCPQCNNCDPCHHRLLKWYDFSEILKNPGINNPLFTVPTDGSPIDLGVSITLSCINADDRVLILGTVGWLAPNNSNATMQFNILSDGVPVYSILDTGTSGEAVATSFHHSETNASGTNVYTLTVQQFLMVVMWC
jgi:hypothetical protein